MTEEFLQYAWKAGSYDLSLVNNLNGDVIEVINSGELNLDSGPDFFNAMIRMGDTILAGNVEVHINSSDWYRHGHHYDKAYDSVILQLVLNCDTEVKRTNGEVIPTAEIRFDPKLFRNYRKLIRNETWIPCQPYISCIDKTLIPGWLCKLAVKRLEQKSLILRDALHLNQNSWEESFYQQLAHNFGFSLNGAVFEMLARSVPYRHLLRNRNNLFQLEAILFGQAGMLGPGDGDEYFEGLKKEYSHLKRKYSLIPLEKHLWRFLRLRPANFPTLRIAQFASLLYNTPSLFSAVLETKNIKTMASFFRVKASEYWDTHFVFNKPAKRYAKTTGEFAIRSILINTIVPVLFFYGQQREMAQFRNRAMKFLEELPAENNSKISKWRDLGITADNALISQALLQQKNEYCSYRRCLNCKIGHHIISHI